jgi:hypothetical protein
MTHQDNLYADGTRHMGWAGPFTTTLFSPYSTTLFCHYIDLKFV